MGSAHNPVAASNGGKCTVSCVRESSSVRNLATPQPAAFLASHEDALALAIYCSPSEALTGCTYAGAQALYIAEAVRGWVAREWRADPLPRTPRETGGRWLRRKTVLPSGHSAPLEQASIRIDR
jgi:hypothetical protein